MFTVVEVPGAVCAEPEEVPGAWLAVGIRSPCAGLDGEPCARSGGRPRAASGSDGGPRSTKRPIALAILDELKSEYQF